MAKRNEYCERGSARTYIHLHTIAVLLCLLLVQSLAGEEKPKRTSTFPQDWLKTLVSIETKEPNKPKEPEKAPMPRGSGFLVGTPEKHLALVTAKHVVFDKEKEWTLRPHLAYRMNRKEGMSDLFTEAEVAKYRPEGWIKSDKHDVACRIMIRREKLSDVKQIEYSHFLTNPTIEPGAPLFVIGFPMGMRSEKYATAILRRGMVARADSVEIVAEVFVFPGNSGGPVVYAPSDITMFLSSMLHDQKLVGLVSECISYSEMAVSPQTGHPRILFEDNAGLCNVVPASAILELLKSPDFVAADTKTTRR